MEPRWEGILRCEHHLAHAHRFGRRALGLLPSPWRCKFCNAPFTGPVAGIVRWIGYAPSRKNPSICARCIEQAADVRGYTALSERLSPAEVPTLVMRFYAAASKALLANGGPAGADRGRRGDGAVRARSCL